jgi:Domain of unknown function (DUF5667)
VTTRMFDRRRAGRFAELVDQAHGQRPRHRLRMRHDGELSTLVALSQQAAALELEPAAAPDHAFRADLRAMLLATAEREGIGATAESPTVAIPTGAGLTRPGRIAGPVLRVAGPALLAASRVRAGIVSRAGGGRRGRAGLPRGRTRVALILAVAVGAMAVSGISAASADAMPGDTLYAVKRSTERAELAFTGSDVGRGRLYLDFARTRLAEADAVSRTAEFAGVLADMDSHTREGVKLLTTVAVDEKDPTALDAVDAFVDDQQGLAGGVLDQVTGAARARLLTSLDLLARVADRSHRLREALTCGIAASDGSDVLGPRPGSCSAGGDAGRPARGGSAPAAPAATRAPRGGSPDRPAGAGGPSSTPSIAPPAGLPEGVAGTGPPARDGGDAGDARDGGDGRDGGAPSAAPAPSAATGGGLFDGLDRILDDLLGA